MLGYLLQPWKSNTFRTPFIIGKETVWPWECTRNTPPRQQRPTRTPSGFAPQVVHQYNQVKKTRLFPASLRKTFNNLARSHNGSPRTSDLPDDHHEYWIQKWIRQTIGIIKNCAEIAHEWRASLFNEKRRVVEFELGDLLLLSKQVLHDDEPIISDAKITMKLVHHWHSWWKFLWMVSANNYVIKDCLKPSKTIREAPPWWGGFASTWVQSSRS